MLERAARITSRKDFNKMFKSGKNFSTPLCMLKVQKTNNPQSRFAFVVSTKVSKSAVVRNRLKRQMREVIRHLRSQIVHGVNVMIVAKPGLNTQGYSQLMGIISELCKKAGILITK